MAAKWYAIHLSADIVSHTHRAQDDPDPNLFATEIRNCAGSNVVLTLWSAKVAFAIQEVKRRA